MNDARHVGLAACLAVCVAALGGCGPAPSCVLIEVGWQGYAVPEQLDALHFVLSDDAGVFVERSLDIPADAPPATLQLCQGPRTPGALQLVVHGLHGAESVAQSPAVRVDFAQSGATVPVQLPPP